MKPLVYVETTIPSYLTAWPSRDLRQAADQEATRESWARRDEFELFLSQLVLDECQAGDPAAAAERYAALAGLPVLDLSAEVISLTEVLMRAVRLPAKAQADAGHIATAAVHGMEYLLTWNCRHIANAVLRPRIEAACLAAGYDPPLICTPRELRSPEDVP
jgi:hypothetical protein